MSYSPSEITIKNLSRLASEQVLTSEERILELHGLVDIALDRAAEYAADGLDTYDILSALAVEDYPLDAPVPRGTPDALLPLLMRYTASLGVLDRALICDLFVRGAVARSLPFAEENLLHSSGGDETFIYTRNAYADEAYDVLSQDFDSPRVRYGASFSDCVRAVSSGECRFCLLPLEERGGTRIATVSELIYRSDLKINAVTPVFGFDGTADLKYALLSRDFVIPECVRGDDRYLEVRVSAKGETVSELFSVVRYLGLTLYRADTHTFDTEGEADTFLTLVLRDGGEGFAALLVYLALFSDGYTPVGLYKNLE